jgi:very-short-patch-repair endonuclease
LFEVNEKTEDGNIVLFERLKKTFKNRVKMCVPYPINGRKYTPNIVIKSFKLVIEVVGSLNDNSEEYAVYDKDFKSIGYTTLRFSNEMVSSKKGKQDIIKQILEIANLKK